QAEDGIRDLTVTGVQTCALPISTFTARGAHAGARVHDEAALLPDQAVNVGGVEPDVLRLARHGVAKRHRKALLDVDHALGSLARSEERRVGKEWRSRV